MDVNPYQSPTPSPTPHGSSPPGHPRPSDRGGYGQAIVLALIQQGVVLGFAALLLDGGYFLRRCTVAALMFWVCALAIILLRPKTPSAFRLLVVKYGFWFALVLVGMSELLVRSWAWNGL